MVDIVLKSAVAVSKKARSAKYMKMQNYIFMFNI